MTVLGDCVGCIIPAGHTATKAGDGFRLRLADQGKIEPAARETQLKVAFDGLIMDAEVLSVLTNEQMRPPHQDMIRDHMQTTALA